MTRLAILAGLAVLAGVAAGQGLGQNSPAATAAASAPTSVPTTTAPVHATIDAEHAARAWKDMNEGLAFVLSARNPDGGWGFQPGQSDPALTAMVLKVLLGHPDYTKDSPAVREGFKALLGFQHDDGGVYVKGNENYTTSVAVMALAAAGDDRYRDGLDKAVKFLRGQQITPGSKDPKGKEIKDDDPWVGGVSYGEHGRPDLSNVGFWMEAMHQAGVPASDPDMQRALGFVKRLQNTTEGTEGQAYVPGGNDGGFIYAVTESKASPEPDAGLRSYGSMTYTGFKSMLYAGLRKDDKRVQAAYDWITKNWSLDTNPNMPEKQSRQGLYYYYMVFARGLAAYGEDAVETKAGPRNWRHELIDVLHAQQKDNGSWVNEADRWFEGHPVLVTAYSMIALQEAVRK